CERKGMLHEAITQWCASLTLGGQPEQAQFLEQAFAASGFDAAVRALAQRQLQHLNERSARGEYVPAWNYLTAYLRLGDKEQALVWLAKTVEEPNWFALESRVTPILILFAALRASTNSSPFVRQSNTDYGSAEQAGRSRQFARYAVPLPAGQVSLRACNPGWRRCVAHWPFRIRRFIAAH